MVSREIVQYVLIATALEVADERVQSAEIAIECLIDHTYVTEE
jgi:hypothetical protein